MTETEQRVACALACGWMGLNENCLDDCVCFNPKGVMCDGAPDYPNDLNAMHEAEKTLTPKEELLYVERLSAEIMTAAYEDDERWLKSDLSSTDSTYRATCLQRCKSFLKTKGLWK